MRRVGWIVIVGILVGFGWGATESLAGKGKGGGGGAPANTTPPDIAFTLNSDLYVLQDDGTGLAKLVEGIVRHPAWSPDGTQIAFVGTVSGTGFGPGLYIVDADGTDLRKVCSVMDWTLGYGISWSPAATADGEYKIAFCDDPYTDGYGYVCVVNTDGTELATVGAGRRCAWSPDAAVLAMQSGYTLRLQSFTVDAGLLTPDTYEDHVFTEGYLLDEWSQTGSLVALTKLVASGGSTLKDVFSMDTTDLDASPENLTQTTTVEELWPSWSPDDSKIVYVAQGDLWIRNLSAGTAVKLYNFSNGQGVAHPAWRHAAE